MSFVRLEGLEKTYPDGTRAVRGIDLEIEEGEFVVLLGPSGCGKTTTLRMIAGLELPTAGRVHLAGGDVTQRTASERDVGFVFQFYALYPHLSVADNIAFPLECAGMARGERHAAVRRVAERLGLEALLDRKPRTLSGGDQQRVALARAMVRRPAIYLMDEPLGTLDADRRLEMCELIRAQQLELGVATVYVTHDQEEAMRLADRIVVMDAGRVLQAAPPSEVYGRPETLFVGNFVGSPGMNRLPGELDEAGAFRPTALDAVFDLGAQAPAGPATLGIRPEALRLQSGGPLAGKVVVDEYLGADRCLHLDTAAGLLVVRIPPDGPGLLGQELELDLDLERAHVYVGPEGRRAPRRAQGEVSR